MRIGICSPQLNVGEDTIRGRWWSEIGKWQKSITLQGALRRACFDDGKWLWEAMYVGVYSKQTYWDITIGHVKYFCWAHASRRSVRISTLIPPRRQWWLEDDEGPEESSYLIVPLQVCFERKELYEGNQSTAWVSLIPGTLRERTVGSYGELRWYGDVWLLLLLVGFWNERIESRLNDGLVVHG